MDLKQSLKLKPDNVDASKIQEYVYLKTERYGKALVDLNKLLERKPHNAFALYVCGDVYRMIKQYDKAMNDLNNSLINQTMRMY